MFFFFQAEDGIRDYKVTGVQTCALPISNNGTIEGHPAYGIEQLTAAAGPLLDNANKLLNDTNVLVTGLKKDLDQFMPKLGPLADSLQMDADNLQNVITSLDNLSKGADKVL